MTFEYGSFSSTYDYDELNRSIRSLARLELTEYKIPAIKFLIAKNFFNYVLGEYTEKIVMVRL